MLLDSSAFKALNGYVTSPRAVLPRVAPPGLDPLPAAGAKVSLTILDDMVDHALYRTLAVSNPSPAPRWQTWAGYVGGKGRLEDRDTKAEVNYNYNGAVIGSTYAFSPDAKIGLHMGYADANTRSDDARLNTRAYAGGAFVMVKPMDRLTLDLEAALGYYDNEIARHGLADRRRGEYNQDARSGRVRATYDFNLTPAARLSPFVGASYNYLSQDNYRERARAAADPDADFDRLREDNVSTTLGATLAREFHTTEGRSFTPSFQAAWRRDWSDSNYLTAGRFNDSPNKVSLSQFKGNRNKIELGFNLKATVFKRKNAEVELDGGYKVKISKTSIKHNWYGGITVKF